MDDQQEDEFTAPSKSALKREMAELRKKAEALTALPEKSLAEISLSETLREGILLARKMKKTDARRRQINYLVKLIKLDDLEAINNALETSQQQHQNFQQRFKKIEALRNTLLENGDEAINQLLATQTKLDRQHLRQLVRQAHRETAQRKPPAASRKLFRYLQENIT